MTILTVVFPVFAIALGGFLVARFGILSERDIDGLSRFVFTIAIPVLLFNALGTVELPDQLNWQFMLAYYGAILVIFGVGMWLGGRFFGLASAEKSVYGLGASYSNMILVGLPIISTGLGDEALLPLFMLVSIHSALLFFLVTVLAEQGNGKGLTARQIGRQTAEKLTRNPIIIGLATGIAFNLLPISLPPLLDTTLDRFGDASLPCALFVLGASLVRYQVAGHLHQAGVLVGLKMIVQPALVAVLAFGVFQLDPLWGAVAVMVAGMPIGVNAYIMAEKYETGIATLSTAVLLSTLFAVVSQTILLAIFL